MATVQRFYRWAGASSTEIPRIVAAATILNGSRTWAAIEFDDAVAGMTETLDEYMTSLGFVEDAAAGAVLRFRIEGVVLDIGAGSALFSAYDCDAGVAVGEAVCLSAADTVDEANATDNTKPAIGFVIAKPTATRAIVKHYGEVGGFVGLTPGATYFLDTTDGLITSVAPLVLGNIVQRLGFARNATTLVLEINRDWTVL